MRNDSVIIQEDSTHIYIHFCLAYISNMKQSKTKRSRQTKQLWQQDNMVRPWSKWPELRCQMNRFCLIIPKTLCLILERTVPSTTDLYIPLFCLVSKTLFVELMASISYLLSHKKQHNSKYIVLLIQLLGTSGNSSFHRLECIAANDLWPMWGVLELSYHTAEHIQ